MRGIFVCGRAWFIFFWEIGYEVSCSLFYGCWVVGGSVMIVLDSGESYVCDW